MPLEWLKNFQNDVEFIKHDEVGAQNPAWLSGKRFSYHVSWQDTEGLGLHGEPAPSGSPEKSKNHSVRMQFYAACLIQRLWIANCQGFSDMLFYLQFQSQEEVRGVAAITGPSHWLMPIAKELRKYWHYSFSLFYLIPSMPINQFFQRKVLRRSGRAICDPRVSTPTYPCTSPSLNSHDLNLKAQDS